MLYDLESYLLRWALCVSTYKLKLAMCNYFTLYGALITHCRKLSIRVCISHIICVTEHLTFFSMSGNEDLKAGSSRTLESIRRICSLREPGRDVRIVYENMRCEWSPDRECIVGAPECLVKWKTLGYMKRTLSYPAETGKSSRLS